MNEVQGKVEFNDELDGADIERVGSCINIGRVFFPCLLWPILLTPKGTTYDS